jgi:hypothetical protein
VENKEFFARTISPRKNPLRATKFASGKSALSGNSIRQLQFKQEARFLVLRTRVHSDARDVTNLAAF